MVERERICKSCGYKWKTVEIGSEEYIKLLFVNDDESLKIKSGKVIVNPDKKLAMYVTRKNAWDIVNGLLGQLKERKTKTE